MCKYRAGISLPLAPLENIKLSYMHCRNTSHMTLNVPLDPTYMWPHMAPFLKAYNLNLLIKIKSQLADLSWPFGLLLHEERKEN